MSIFNATAILAVVQLFALSYSIYGLSVHAFTEVVLAAVFVMNSLSILEDIMERWAPGSAVPNSWAKQLQKSTLIKTLGLDVLTALKMSNIAWLALLLLLASISILTAPRLLSVEVVFRLLLIAALAIKLPLLRSLRKLTSLLKHWSVSEFSAAHVGLYKHSVLVFSCFVELPRLSAELEHVLNSPPTAISTASLESALLQSSVSPAVPLPTASTTDSSGSTVHSMHISSVGTAQQSFGYSPTLSALLLFAAVEAAVLTVVLSTPLLLAILESTHPIENISTSAGRYRIFAPLYCALQLLGAYLQIAALYFAGAYLRFGRTVALELRRVVAGPCSGLRQELRSRSGSCDSISRVTADTAVRKIGTFSSLLRATRRSLLSQVYAILDCDARTLSVDPLSSAGASDADAFASGAAVVSNTGAVASTSVPAGKQHSPRGTALRTTSSSGRTTSAGIQSNNSSSAGRGVIHAQSYLLNFCCLLVLGVAALHLLLALCGCADQRGARAQVFVSSAALLLVVDLLSPGSVAALCSQ